MRLSGIVDTAGGLGRHDHVGWAFARSADFRAVAGQFLDDGLASQERVLYVAGPGTPAPAVLDDAVADGRAEVASVAELYGADRPVEPERQVSTFAAEVERALADGWTGLRVAADITSLVRTERQRAAWIRYEHLVDAFIAATPLAGLCGFDRRVLGEAALAEVSCLHPALTPDSSDFRLYTTPDPDTGFALAGEIDPGNRRTLETVLREAHPAPRDGRITVDVTALTFVDHHGLAALADYAAERGVTAVIRACPGSVPKMIADLVPMSGLEVQVVSA
ncbi:MEDS domain-containing protein [Actinoplanes sp. NPDC020271]|uniref:MEDS domain-containing protein n=1 Tax=Actinoplanes sp. NPDC020271 TaxID=3363896 RepID=UPI0037A8D5BB